MVGGSRILFYFFFHAQNSKPVEKLVLKVHVRRVGKRVDLIDREKDVVMGRDANR